MRAADWFAGGDRTGDAAPAGHRLVVLTPAARLPRSSRHQAVGGGSVGGSYDIALAETINGLYEAAGIHRRSWRSSLQDLELATREIVQPHVLAWAPADADANYHQLIRDFAIPV